MAALASKRKRDDHDLGSMRAAPGMQMHDVDYNNTYMQDDANPIAFADLLAQHDANGADVEEDDHEDVKNPGYDSSLRR